MPETRITPRETHSKLKGITVLPERTMPEIDPETPKAKGYPAITIADLHLVMTVLNQIKDNGSGALDRTAKILETNPSMVTLTMNRVEAVVGQAFVVKGKRRRRPILTTVGDQFRYSAGDILKAWDQTMYQVAAAVDLEQRWHEDDQREIDERDAEDRALTRRNSPP